MGPFGRITTNSGNVRNVPVYDERDRKRGLSAIQCQQETVGGTLTFINFFGKKRRH
jgi:hypothetical protein